MARTWGSTTTGPRPTRRGHADSAKVPLALAGGMALWGLAGTQLRFKHISDFKFLLVDVLTVRLEPCRPRPLQHLREYFKLRQHHGIKCKSNFKFLMMVRERETSVQSPPNLGRRALALSFASWRRAHRLVRLPVCALALARAVTHRLAPRAHTSRLLRRASCRRAPRTRHALGLERQLLPVV